MILLLTSLEGYAGRDALLARYGVVDSSGGKGAMAQTVAMVDSMIKLPLGKGGLVYKIEPVRMSVDRTPDFYLLLFLCGILGAIRYTNPRYFGMLMRAFQNTGTSRGLREGIQGDVISNALMNLLFGVVAGAYLFYMARGFGNPLSRWVHYGNPGLLGVCIGGMLGIYIVKYLVIKFTGWAFRVTAITDQYLFNVFLINKIIGIVLLPFLVVIAFSPSTWVYSLVFMSLLGTGLLVANRYVRSWPIFSSFFQQSRFHFFTYLCASEILPMAIIVKLLLRFA